MRKMSLALVATFGLVGTAVAGETGDAGHAGDANHAAPSIAKFDTDKDGTVSIAEAKADAILTKYFTELDKNNDHSIDAEELKTLSALTAAK